MGFSVCTEICRMYVSAQICLGFQCLHRTVGVRVCTEVWVSLSAQRCGCLCFHRDGGVCVFTEMWVSVCCMRVPETCRTCVHRWKTLSSSGVRNAMKAPSLIPAACQHWQQQCLGRLTNQRTACNAYALHIGSGGMNNGLKRLKRKVDINFLEITSS